MLHEGSGWDEGEVEEAHPQGDQQGADECVQDSDHAPRVDRRLEAQRLHVQEGGNESANRHRSTRVEGKHSTRVCCQSAEQAAKQGP